MKYMGWVLLAGAAWAQLGQTGGPVVPQPTVCDSSQALAVTSQGTAMLVTGEAGKSIEVCGFVLNADGSTTIRLVRGTGNQCGSGQATLTPAFKMSNGSTVTFGGATGRLLKLPAGNSLCVTTSNNTDAALLVVYAKK